MACRPAPSIISSCQMQVPPPEAVPPSARREVGPASTRPSRLISSLEPESLPPPVATFIKDNPHTFLLTLAYAPATVRSYFSAAGRFLNWAADHFPGANPWNAYHVDDILTEYIHVLARSGWALSEARNCLNGLVAALFLPKGPSLPMARIALRGWSRMRPSKQHLPIPWAIAVLMATHCRENVKQRRPDPPALRFRKAVGILVAFNGLLRLNELCDLTPESVSAPDHECKTGHFNGPCIHLWLSKTKTGPDKAALIDHPDVMLLLMKAKSLTEPGKRIFPFSKSYTPSIHSAQRDLGLPVMVFHGLRHGAASRLHNRGVPLEEIRIRGRWAAHASSLHYIQGGQAALLKASIPDELISLGNLIGNSIIRHFRQDFALTQYDSV